MQISVFKPNSRNRDFRAMHPNPAKLVDAVMQRIGDNVPEKQLASFKELVEGLANPSGIVIDSAQVHIGDRRIKIEA